MVVYASPPVSGGDMQRFAKEAHLCPVKVRSRGRQLFAKCSHLWPSSVFKHSPADGFQIFTVAS